MLAGPLTAMGDPIIVSHQFLIPSAKELSYLLSPISGGTVQVLGVRQLPTDNLLTSTSGGAAQESDFAGKSSEVQGTAYNSQPKTYDVEISAPVSAMMGGGPLLRWRDKVVLIDADISAGDGLPGESVTSEQMTTDAQHEYRVMQIRGGNGRNGLPNVIAIGGGGQVNVGRPGGPPRVIRGGSGGRGGDAGTIRAPIRRNPATGGNGGGPGIDPKTRWHVGIIAEGASELNFDGPTIYQVGNGGNGGDAVTKGAEGEECKRGMDAPPAKGGNGGHVGQDDEGRHRPFFLDVKGKVKGLQNLTVAGGMGGRGGDAVATGGKGGDCKCKKGGDGGNATDAKGGDGGDVEIDTRGYPVQVASAPSFQGGDGGNATAIGGTGGDGVPPGGPGQAKGAKAGKGGKSRVVHPPAVQRRDGKPGNVNIILGAPGKPLSACLPVRAVDLSFGIIPGFKDCWFFTLATSVGRLAVDSLSGGEFLAAAHQNLNSLAIIDLASRQLKMISVGSQPHSVEMTRDGRRAFVGNFGSGDISVVDIPNQRVIETVRVGRQTAALAFDPTTNKLYAVNFGDNNVAVVQYREGGSQVVGAVRGLREPIYVALSPDGRRGYVSSQRRGQDIAVFDTVSTNIVGRIPMPNLELRKLAVSPDGKRLYAAARTDAQGTGQVAVIDTTSLQIVQRIPVEAFPLALTVTPSGACLIVTHSFPNKVSFIDLKTEKVLAVLPSGQSPQAAAIGGELAYVTNLESDAINVYNLGSCQ